MPYLDEDTSAYLPSALDRLMMKKIMLEEGHELTDFTFHDHDENYYMASDEYCTYLGWILEPHGGDEVPLWENEKVWDELNHWDNVSVATIYRFTMIKELEDSGKMNSEQIVQLSKIKVDLMESFFDGKGNFSNWAHESDLFQTTFNDPYALIIGYEDWGGFHICLGNFICVFNKFLELYKEIMGREPRRKNKDVDNSDKKELERAF